MTATAKLDASTNELLQRAVHQHDALSVIGALERTFTFAFRSMVYPQIWEDPRADLEALQLTPQSRVMTIASGGCNALSYLIDNPSRIYAVDLNATHVALVNLKIAAARYLPTHATYVRFFGDASDHRNTHLYDDLIAPHLDATSRAYWEGRDVTGRRRITRFARGFYRYGLLGKFIGTGHWLARLLGADPSRIAQATSLDEQRRIFATELAPLFDRPIVRWLTSNRASLFGLGIPPAQYDALCENGARAMHDVLRERTERLATAHPLTDNYFAWQAFARRYDTHDTASLPPYLQGEHFMALKARVNRVTVLQQNMIDFLAGEPSQSLDRYVLLDAQDWMDDATLNALWREVTRTARADARVIFRTAGRDTILPGRVDGGLLEHWNYDRDTSARVFAKDRSAIYGGFHLYTRDA